MDCSDRLASPILQDRRRGPSMGTFRRSLPSLWTCGRGVFLARHRVLGLRRVLLGAVVEVRIALEIKTKVLACSSATVSSFGVASPFSRSGTSDCELRLERSSLSFGIDMLMIATP